MRTTGSFKFRVYVYDRIQEPTIIYTETFDLAKQEYNRNLKALQAKGKRFHTAINLEFEAKGSHSWSYYLGGHNEKGPVHMDEAEYDRRTLEKHIQTGFFSANPTVAWYGDQVGIGTVNLDVLR